MFRAMAIVLVFASLSGCAAAPPQQQVVGQAALNPNAPDILGTAEATATQAAPAPTAPVPPQPQVVYVPQPVYVYVPQPTYVPSQAQAGWGAVGSQSGCGLVGDCGRSAHGRDVDVNLNRDNCTSHVFGDTIQTSCY